MRPFLTTLLVLLGLSASAQAGGQKPGSLLVFPEYDNRPGSLTLLTVTNTNGDFQQVSGTQLAGSVNVHFLYVNGDNCTQQNAFEALTPHDTVTLVTGAHSPDPGRGYVYAYARGTQNPAPITFEHLAGSSVIVDGYSGSVYSMQPIVFHGMTEEGTTTDLDSDGIRDLNGLEYSQAPDKTVIPRFFGQAGGPEDAQFWSELVLINLTGGRAFTTSVDFLIFNDNEQAFSGEYTFYCWERVGLRYLSGAVLNSFLRNATNQDPGEVIGMPALEAGWILLDGGVANSTATSISDPAVLAGLVELGRISSAQLPFAVGEQPNGDLLPSSIFGDSSL